MEQARVTAGGPGPRLLVKHHEVAGARAQGHCTLLASVHLEPQRILVEGLRTVGVGNGEVHRAQAQGVGKRRLPDGYRTAGADRSPGTGARASSRSNTVCSRGSRQSVPLVVCTRTRALPGPSSSMPTWLS